MQELEDAVLHGLTNLAQVEAPLQLGPTVVDQHSGLERRNSFVIQWKKGNSFATEWKKGNNFVAVGKGKQFCHRVKERKSFVTELTKEQFCHRVEKGKHFFH